MNQRWCSDLQHQCLVDDAKKDLTRGHNPGVLNTEAKPQKKSWNQHSDSSLWLVD